MESCRVKSGCQEDGLGRKVALGSPLKRVIKETWTRNTRHGRTWKQWDGRARGNAIHWDGKLREGKRKSDIERGGHTLRYILTVAPSSSCFAFPSRTRRVTTLSFVCGVVGVVVNCDEPATESGGLAARL